MNGKFQSDIKWSHCLKKFGQRYTKPKLFLWITQWYQLKLFRENIKFPKQCFALIE